MASKAFITNCKTQAKTLKKRLLELISHSAELKFLVGFFYFSGWRELYSALKEKEDLTIKLLVGLQVDQLMGKLVEVETNDHEKSNREIADRLMESFAKALNDEELDNEEFYEQIDFFIQLLEEGRLQIRKTAEPNHAKLYFFKYDDASKTLIESSFITGSSNLTRAGMREQNEFNVELRDVGANEAETYFDELWDKAIRITEDDATKEFLLELIKNRTQAANVTPFEAYVMVLKTYLELMDQKEIKPQIKELLEKQGYVDYSYQTDAVKQALTIIDQYHGAIIADVVGLGKSVIASLVAKSLGKRGMIICPPGLMGDAKTKTSGWHKYTQDFKLYDWEVHSSGNLEAASDYLNEWGDDIEVVIIDEAHRFRNQDTQDYEYLSTICQGRIVLLLTATPFNNSPADIFSLLKLFIVPGKSGITLEDNLEGRFSHYESIFRRLSYITKNYNSDDPEKREKAERYYEQIFESLPINLERVRGRSKELAQEIRNVLEPILIRRNRLDLRNDPVYSKEVTELSTTENPTELFFELTKEQSAFYDQIQEVYFGDGARFKGAIYKPFMYENKFDEEDLDEEGNRSFQQQRNLYEFMRRLLVKRFESSFGSFHQSISNFLRVHKIVLKFIQNTGKYILDRDLIEKIYNASEEEIENALTEFADSLNEGRGPRHNKIYEVEDFEFKEEFLDHIKSDIHLLEEVRDRIEGLDLATDDPKAYRVIEEIKKIINKKPPKGEPKRKVILFTEYVDTVKHLKKFFEYEFNDEVLIVDGKLGKQKADDLLDNFDASRGKHKQKDDYSILLTSDVLSEGQNLNRAGAIINYDIPWNPTRVIQRVGRINRIGKKVFDSLHIYNFFPTEQGATVVKSREIAANKMYLIHNTLGEDVKIFDADEEPSPSELFSRVNRNPDESDEMAPITQIRMKYDALKDGHKEIFERVEQLPYRIKSAKKFEKDILLVFRKKRLSLFISKVQDTTDEKPKPETVYSIIDSLPHIECGEDEPLLKLSSNFWKSYDSVKQHKMDYSVSHSEISFEVRALNVLKAALHAFKNDFIDEVPFIRTLIKDLTNYRSLPKFTLRKIANIDFEKNKEKAVIELQNALKEIRIRFGEDYLEKLESRVGDMKSEVIIAIENIDNK
jgi:superfamily II DNA or RNA helicase/HKD family nuclease